jgi:hypothetical protein
MKIFLDMDGVLVDFNRPALFLHGISYDIYPCSAGWDIIRACNILRPELNMTPGKFWGKFNQRFWATLPKTNLCDTLIRTVEGYVGAENVALLTSGQWPEAAAGKTEWVRDNLPSYRERLIIGTAKEFLAGPDRLLIDDRDKNVEDFRAAGGSAILVPRPWNTKWQKRLPASYVLEQLAIMFGRL